MKWEKGHLDKDRRHNYFETMVLDRGEFLTLPISNIEDLEKFLRDNMIIKIPSASDMEVD